MWNRIDLEEQLERTRRQEQRKQADATLEEFKRMLRDEDELDEEILRNVLSNEAIDARIPWQSLNPDKMYSLSQIKTVCTHYRLRFLDASLFKGEIPYEAIAKIKHLQKQEDITLKGFKIVAPAPMFHLEELDKDPLLFLPLGNDRYYLIHKWGKDLHPLRKWVMFPFRNFKSLLASIAAVAFAIVMAVPNAVIMGPYDQSSVGLRIIFFLYLFIAISGLTVLYGFSRVKNFNNVLWNSKYRH